MKLVIIDTGVSLKLKVNKNISGVGIASEGKKFCVVDDYLDEIGHGTAVTDLVLQYCDNVEIFMVKLYGSDEFVTPEKLVFALRYIADNIDFDIIQISSGVLVSTVELYRTIKDIAEQDVLIISAFDNDGALSYPAAYEEVIGIDLNLESKDKEAFQVLEDDIVDIRVGCGYYRTIDHEGNKVILKGSSFANSYIVAKIISSTQGKIGKRDIKEILGIKEEKDGTYREPPKSFFNFNKFIEEVNSVAIFPFNKEIHSIARFEETLPFEKYIYYDIKHKFMLGKEISDVLKDTTNNHVIRDFEKIDWSADFDMFICGHVLEIEDLTGKDYRKLIYNMCKKYHKKLYCFDNMSDVIKSSDYGKNVFFPFNGRQDIPTNRFGKLRKVGIPVLAVIGTSSRQGKHTLQLKLKNELEKCDFRVGFLSTEPNGYLLGADQMLPFGYNSSCYLGEKLTNVANEMIWEIEKNGVDIIITGCQSGTLHYDTTNEALLTYNQFYFLTGTNPDGLILCVNNFDDIEYIERTIRYVTALTEAKIIMAVISGVNKSIMKKNFAIESFFETNNIIYRYLEEIKNDEMTGIVLNYYS